MKVLGCQYWFEVYLEKSTLDANAWNKTIQAILHHVGVLRTVKFVLKIDGNMVHYYAGANKNLSGLSNKLEKMVFRPIDGSTINLPTIKKAERFVMLVPDGGLLDVRERYEIKRGKSLNFEVVSVRNLTLLNVHTETSFLFEDADGVYSSSNKQSFSLPGRLLAINFRENEKYRFRKLSNHLDIKKSLHILKSDKKDALFEIDTFPYLANGGYVSLASYDFDKHSFIVGSSGSGKSKLISLFVDRLLRSPVAHNYRVVVIDPHASIEKDLETIADANIVKFKSQADRTELFAEGGTDISAATELTCTLFRSLLGEQHNAKVDRLLRFSLIVLMTAQVMSIPNLKRFLKDDSYRAGILEHTRGYVPENITLFFGTEFDEINTHHAAEAIAPIIDLVDELGMQPSLASSESQTDSLAKVIGSHRLSVFSLDKVGMGEKVIKTVSGLLIQQIFLLAQARTFGEKIILIIDEVSIIQNPTIGQILAEARKYNLFVFLTQQYFGQIDQSLQNAIFSNVSNYYVFKVSEHDARLIEGNITMELPKKTIMESTRVMNKEEDLRVPILTELDLRECVIRLSSDGKLLPAMKARTLDYEDPVPQASTKTLVEYDAPKMPMKYTEPTHHTVSDTQQHRPQTQPVQSTNLMEILAKQSSQRNKKG